MATYLIDNYNPSLGPVIDGKLNVSVYDRDLGNMRTVSTTPQEADEFVKNRKTVLTAANKDGIKLGVGIAAATAVACAVAGAIMGAVRTGKINKAADKLNAAIQQLGDNVTSEVERKIQIQSMKMESPFWADLKFNETLGQFVHFDKLKAAVNYAKWGVAGGLGLGAILGSIASFGKVELADKKITNEFIEANKDNA